jgi:hypothetical protein
MHTKPLTLARKFFTGLLAMLALLLLAGCDMTLTNLTPSSLAENPSQIYTLSLRVKVASGAISKESVSPLVVVGGKSFKMKKSPLGEGLYDFDYQAPAGTDALKYYFLVQYNVFDSNGMVYAHERYTEVAQASIARRYVLSLEVTRGPVGARVSILGRGFTPQDVIYFENVATRTVHDSANSLSFFVPAVEANRNYRVSLASASGNSPVGTFRVDPATVSVSPSSLVLRSGQHQTLTFTLPYPASAGGVLLDVTTDVPESIIMPEVVIPAGQTSVTIPVQGGKKGTGTLFLKGFAQGEIGVPVTVN